VLCLTLLLWIFSGGKFRRTSSQSGIRPHDILVKVDPYPLSFSFWAITSKILNIFTNPIFFCERFLLFFPWKICVEWGSNDSMKLASRQRHDLPGAGSSGRPLQV